MKRSIKKLLSMAKEDKEFCDDYLSADPDAYIPGFFSSHEMKHLFVAIYMGWLIAHKRYTVTTMLAKNF